MASYLAMSGGGERGCLLVGMLDRLHKMSNVQWQAVAGISAGALVGSMVAQSTEATFQETIDQLKSMFLSKDFHVVDSWTWGGDIVNFLDAFLFHDSIFQNTPLKQLIADHFDTANCQRKLYVGAYNRSLHRYETFDTTATNLPDAILASAAVPVIFPPVEIDTYLYEDGGVEHLIPVLEIEQWVKSTVGKKHVDVLVCYPINNYKAFNDITAMKTEYPLLNNMARTLSDDMLSKLKDDLQHLAKLCGVSYEELTKSNCGTFINGDLTVRILSTKDGQHHSFVHMDPKVSMELYHSGESAVIDYLTPALKV